MEVLKESGRRAKSRFSAHTTGSTYLTTENDTGLHGEGMIHPKGGPGPRRGLERRRGCPSDSEGGVEGDRLLESPLRGKTTPSVEGSCPSDRAEASSEGVSQ